MFSKLVLRIATFAAVVLTGATLAPAAHAQDVFGAYCGQVTWNGQAPIHTWLVFMNGGRYSTASSDGAFTDAPDGAYVQNGTSLTLRSDLAPNYAATATAANARVVGVVTDNSGRSGVISLTQMTGTGAGLRSSPLPPDFSSDAAQRALNGQIEAVGEAVTWSWTPQGSDYWRAIQQSGQLPPAAADALRDWIRRAQVGERPVCDAQ